MSHEHDITVVTERSKAGLITAVVAVVLLLLLVWAVFFSGWFVDRGSETPNQTNIQETEEGDTNIQQPQQPQQPQPTETTGGGGRSDY